MNKNRILYWNANGLLDRMSALTPLLTSGGPAGDQPHVDMVALTETHIDPRARSRCPPISGFNGWSLPFRSTSGGLAIYARNTLIAKRAAEYDYVDAGSPTAAMWIRVRPFPNSRTELLLAVVYRHQDTSAAQLADLLSSLRRVVDSHTDRPVLILGDFNCRSRHWGDTVDTSSVAPSIIRFLSDSSLFTLNQHFIPGRPTRPALRTDCESTVIDLAITNQPGLIGDMSVADQYGLHSDHLPLQVDLVRRPNDPIIKGPGNLLAAHRIQWRTRDADWSAFRDRLEQLIMHLLGPLPAPSGTRSAQSIIDERWDKLRNAIMDAAHETIGIKQPGFNLRRWWSYPLANMSATYRTYRRAITAHKRSSPSSRARTKVSLVAARREWKTAYKAARRWEWTELCRAVESDPRVLSWIGFKATTGSTPRASLTSVTDTDDRLPLNTDESLFNFATALFKAAVPPRRSTEHDAVLARVAAAARHYTCNPALDSLGWSCTADGVGIVCTHLAAGRAYGSDNVHPAFLKHGGTDLYAALAALYNYSYRHAVIPLQWTQSLVVPLYKDGDMASADSYRPISLTSVVMRTMEHLIQDRLITLVDTVLHPFQYGFRPRHSTYNAIHHLTEDLRLAARGRTKSATPVAFLDLRKAFDRVWHDGLLNMLIERGITGRIWLWLRAFISNRCSCVVNGGSSSGWFYQRYGVPQGAVLSPTLFIIFFDALAGKLQADPETRYPRTVLLKYADDTAVYPNVLMPDWQSRFQYALDKLTDWSWRSCQEFHPKKSQIVWFTRQRNFQPPRTYRLGGFVLDSVPSYRYLGVHLDADFEWKTHLKEVRRRISHDAFNVRRIIDHGSDRPIHFSTVRSIAVSYLLPRCTYGLPLMPPTPALTSLLERVESELCSTIRAVLKLPRSAPKVSVLIEAGLLPMSVFHCYHILRTAYNMSRLPIGHATAIRFASSLTAAAELDEQWSQWDAAAALQNRQSARARYEPARIRSFYWVLRQIEDCSGISHTRLDTMVREVVAVAYAHWKSLPKGLLLQSLKHHRADSPTIGRSHYLYLDTAQHARVRAAFRFDRIQSNGSMFRMNNGAAGTTPTPNCPCCPDSEESITHMVNDCPLYSVHRAVVSHYTKERPGPFFTKFVLGGDITDEDATDEAKTQRRRRELQITGEFLIGILSARQLPAR
jgi:hypothetical protein